MRHVAPLFALLTLSLVLASYSGIIPAKWLTAPQQNRCYRTIVSFCDSNGNTFMDPGECVYDVLNEVSAPTVVCTRGNFVCCYQMNSTPCANCSFAGYQFSFIRYKQFPN